MRPTEEGDVQDAVTALGKMEGGVGSGCLFAAGADPTSVVSSWGTTVKVRVYGHSLGLDMKWNIGARDKLWMLH